ncbi:Unknown protein [Striga hermonthica]|uniref:Uncharacterized protein n=1 Tax=Striga hermonthica TaxID=68872 RepID=A0A9N7R7T5_STRHE|nr:Unknown protein [Striga hermonthica]
MSSTGASYASVFVQQKRLTERLIKRAQLERAASVDTNNEAHVEKPAAPDTGKTAGRNKKVHPTGFIGSDVFFA